MEKLTYLENNSYITSDPNIESEDTIIILPEIDTEEKYNEEDFQEMAEILEIDIKENPEYKKFVYEALYAKLPENWRLYKNRKGDIFYIDILTEEKKDENPIFEIIREKIKKINSAKYLDSEISGFDDNKFDLKKKSGEGYFLENKVSLHSLDKNFSDKKYEKKNFTFNKINNDVVIIKKETFSDFNNQLNILKNKIEKLEKTIENNPNLKTDRFKNIPKKVNSDEKILKNFIKKKTSYTQLNNRGLEKNNLYIKNNELYKSQNIKKENKQNEEYYKKFEKEENYKNQKNESYVRNSKYKKNDEYFKNSKHDDYYLNSKKDSFSKYSDPTFKSTNSENLKNMEFKNLKNEVTNLKTIIDKYVDKEKPQNQLAYYNSLKRKNNDIKSIYSPQKNLKRKIEHPNLTPFIQKSKESIIEKLDSFQKESEKKILRLDFCNKRMKILFDEKKKMENDICRFSKLKNSFKRKKKYLKSLKKKIMKYNNDNKKSSKLFNDLKDTYKNLKEEYKDVEKKYFKEKTILNLKKKLLEKFEVALNTKNNTFEFYENKIKEYFEELSNINNLDKIENNDSIIILEKDENEERLNSSISLKSYNSLKKSFSVSSLQKNLIKSSQKKKLKKKNLNIKKKQSFQEYGSNVKNTKESVHEYGSVKNLITNMQKKYNFPKRSEYYQKSENQKFNHAKRLNRSEHKFNNSFISKNSNKTYLTPINNMKKKSYSRESAIRKKRNFSNSIFSRQTTFFKELRNEVDGILKSFNVSNLNRLS